MIGLFHSPTCHQDVAARINGVTENELQEASFVPAERKPTKVISFDK